MRTHILNKWQDKIFTAVHKQNLVYNTCWEDPACDRTLLGLNADSRVVVITSAGCNALDYLLDKPASIACVDMNPRQNALLELKLALFRHGNADFLQRFFLNGHDDEAGEIYHQHLRAHLTAPAAQYWDKKIRYFTGRRSFYYRGSSGAAARIVFKLLRNTDSRRQLLENLFNAETLEDQREAYLLLEKKMLNRLVFWILNRRALLMMAGVPEAQRQLMQDYQGGAANYIREAFRHLFCEIPLKTNYFWQVYYRGRYTEDAHPNYLRAENFAALHTGVDKISVHTRTISQFLQENPGAYTHFILLDHQDWLSARYPEALHEEWSAILRNAAPGARILMRSAAAALDFLPDFVRERVSFSAEQTEIQHKLDRVGTYGSVHLGIVDEPTP